ncbi:MAG: serine/threonine-protein kinase, partial [Chloroflexota bacterium]
MITLQHYNIKEKIYDGRQVQVYRGIRKIDQTAVILKILKDAQAPQQIAKLKQEYETLRRLNPGLDPEQRVIGVNEAYSLEEDQQHWVLVLEDLGGESLERLRLAGNLSIIDFLHLALQITDIVEQIHQQQIIHKNINPSNIILNPTTGQVKLIDFEIAMPLAQQQASTRRSGSRPLEGTLAYISPEQTGRMNRDLDYRSDFYSLGITFYELLTGQVPFAEDDTLAMIHSHLAQQPPSPTKLRAHIPEWVSDIIMTLIAKNVEDRYQSAQELQQALHESLHLWQGEEQVDSVFITHQFDTIENKSTKTFETENLDLNTVVKAYQTISGEIILNHLLDKIMKIVIESAGAERGVLLLESEGEWLIGAE